MLPMLHGHHMTSTWFGPSGHLGLVRMRRQRDAVLGVPQVFLPAAVDFVRSCSRKCNHTVCVALNQDPP